MRSSFAQRTDKNAWLLNDSAEIEIAALRTDAYSQDDLAKVQMLIDRFNTLNLLSSMPLILKNLTIGYYYKPTEIEFISDKIYHNISLEEILSKSTVDAKTYGKILYSS